LDKVRSELLDDDNRRVALQLVLFSIFVHKNKMATLPIIYQRDRELTGLVSYLSHSLTDSLKALQHMNVCGYKRKFNLKSSEWRRGEVVWQ